MVFETLKWYLKQLFPLKYDTVYGEKEKSYAVIWRMWFGRSFNIKKYEIVKQSKVIRAYLVCALKGKKMKEIKLKLNGKEYIKGAPTVDDWFLTLGATEKIGTKNAITDPEAANAVIGLVASYMKISIDDIRKDGNLEEIISVYHTMQKNILEAFTKASEVWGKNAETPEV